MYLTGEGLGLHVFSNRFSWVAIHFIDWYSFIAGWSKLFETYFCYTSLHLTSCFHSNEFSSVCHNNLKNEMQFVSCHKDYLHLRELKMHFLVLSNHVRLSCTCEQIRILIHWEGDYWCANEYLSEFNKLSEIITTLFFQSVTPDVPTFIDQQ
jgi:hypothetical protein